jgi:hypothetical protein
METTDAMREAYEDVLAELGELAELWLEWRTVGRDTRQVDVAIAQATRESRRYEEKLRRG